MQPLFDPKALRLQYTSISVGLCPYGLPHVLLAEDMNIRPGISFGNAKIKLSVVFQFSNVKIMEYCYRKTSVRIGHAKSQINHPATNQRRVTLAILLFSCIKEDIKINLRENGWTVIDQIRIATMFKQQNRYSSLSCFLCI